MRAAVYLVATPIGNLEDITLRAIRTLRECDLIACEDTRHTRKLLNRYEIQKPLISCHEHNEHERANQIIERVQSGQAVAIVSDAGLPGISDPGYRVVQAAIAAGVRVIPIPGPSAVDTAVVASGLPTDSFLYAGFLPAKSGQRIKALDALAAEKATLVFYEAPHRLLRALADAQSVLGNRQAVVARELTKTHEEFLRGTLAEIHADLAARESVRGEIVLLIAGTDDAPAVDPEVPLSARVEQLVAEGASPMDAVKTAAKEYGVSKRKAYNLVEQEKS
ncbi:MAG: 16S rRNA (cytidine(1402)-2'-O)-methyltransferase [Acidobacteria bacterium]|nr:16S rRNA (cytidine(1402)-2'-O)-methyltransferase [Acidobacteriota bacterium]MDA1233198.1 16S rRNA (cytidine(1402)-2'-O)-methyltransferase [Acidobacteriota bacterium]